jgi:hypothetical protein
MDAYERICTNAKKGGAGHPPHFNYSHIVNLGEGYYPDGGYGYAEGLADVDAWEHAAELSHS